MKRTMKQPAGAGRASRSRRRERGVALMLVMFAVAMATILSMSFVARQGTSSGIRRNMQRQTEARMLAESALELVTHHVRTTSDWRSDLTHDTWVTAAVLDGGTFDFKLTDGDEHETDGDLSDDTSDLVTITVRGRWEGVAHEVSAVVTPAVSGTTLAVLYVTNDPDSLSSQDQAKITAMTTMGFTVTPISVFESQADLLAAAELVDVIYLTEEILSSNLNTKLKNTTRGVVNEEPALADEFGLASSFSAYNGTAIEITDNAHYITQVFPLGDLTITTGTTQLERFSGTFGDDVVTLGTHTSNSNPTLMILEAPGFMYGGGISAGRRVQLPWGGDSFDFTELNQDGRELMKRALQWAAALPPTPAAVLHYDFANQSGTTVSDRIGSINLQMQPGNGAINWVTSPNGTGVEFVQSASNGSAVIRTAAPSDADSLLNALQASNAITVQVYFEQSGGHSSGGRLFSYSTNTNVNDRNFSVIGDPAGGGFDNVTRLRTASGTFDDGPGNAWEADEPTVVAFTYDEAAGDELTVYVNGEAVYANTSSKSDFANWVSRALLLGNELTLDRPFVGTLYDVKVWDQALSGAMLARNAAQLLPSDDDEPNEIAVYEFAESVPTPTLVGQWKLDEAGAAVTQMGYTAAGQFAGFTSSPGNVFAMRTTLAEAGTMTAISAYINGPAGNKVRYALYEDDAGLPGDLVAETDVANIASTTFQWQSLDTPATELDAGAYWLAMTFDTGWAQIGVTLGGGPYASRNAPGAVDGGYPASFGWTLTSALRLSIYAEVEGAESDAVDENAGNDGAKTGTVANQPGHDGTAVAFDGDDLIVIPHAPGYMLDSGTVSFWFKTNANAATQGLFSKASSGFDNGGHLNIYAQSRRIKATLESTTAAYELASAAMLNDDTWYHVVVTWGRGSGFNLYVNGALVESETYYGGLGTTSGGTGNEEPIVLGADTALSGDQTHLPVQNHLDGVMDEVRIYNVALQAPQITSLYATDALGATPLKGTLVADTSGYGAALNLYVTQPDNVTWISGGGLRIDSATTIRSHAPAQKLYDVLTATDQFSIVAVVTPANVTQTGPANIVSYSHSPSQRNATLGQSAQQFNARVRTTSTGADGLQSDSSNVLTTTEQQHLIIAYDGEQVRLYRDGEQVADDALVGELSWDSAWELLLGNERTGNRPWLGTLHRVAIYDAAFNLAQSQNITAGLPPGAGDAGAAQNASVRWNEAD